jgi:hypothetical protein
MSLVEKKRCAVFFGSERVVFRRRDQPDSRQSDLVPPRRSFVFANGTGDLDARLLANDAEKLEILIGYIRFAGDRLDETGAVAKNEKSDTPTRPGVVHPASESHSMPDVGWELFDVRVFHVETPALSILELAATSTARHATGGRPYDERPHHTGPRDRIGKWFERSPAAATQKEQHWSRAGPVPARFEPQMITQKHAERQRPKSPSDDPRFVRRSIITTY